MSKELRTYLLQYDRELRVTTNEHKIVTCVLAVAMLFVLGVVWGITFDHFFIAGMICTVLIALACVGIAARAIADRITE